MKTWREDIALVEGKEYRARKDFKTQTDVFTKGEILIFTGNDYSHYNSSTALRFTDKATGEGKSWFLHDDESDSSAEFFESVA